MRVNESLLVHVIYIYIYIVYYNIKYEKGTFSEGRCFVEKRDAN